VHSEKFSAWIVWFRKFLRAGGVAQVLECLPSKPEALSSNSSMAKEKRKKENY
jgi:hypothetical protein